MKERLTHIAILLFAAAIGHFVAYKLVHIPPQLEVVVIATVLLFYPIMRRPLIGLYAVFIILPFIPFFRRLYYLVYTRPDLDPLIVVGDMLLVFILMGLFFEFRERRDQGYGAAIIVRVIFIYFVYLIVRTFFFNKLPVAEAITKFKYYGPPVLFFFVGTVFYNKMPHLKRFWFITISIGIIASLYGLNQLYNGYSKAEIIWFSSIKFSTLFIEGIPRPFSLFQAPVAFADYIQLGVIAILMCFVWTKRNLYIFLIAAIPLLIYAVLVTSVRSSWLGVIFTFLIWGIFFRIKGNKRRLLALVIVLLGYIVYQYTMETFDAGFNLESGITLLTNSFSNQQQFNLLVTDRTSAIYNPLQEHSFLSRLILWKNLLAYSKDPIMAVLGRGVGTLKADSVYFTYLAEFGYPGMFFIIALFFFFTLKGLHIIDTAQDPDTVALAKGVTVMNIVFAIISITGTHIHYFPGDIYFWFWNGVMIQQAALIKPGSAEELFSVPDEQGAREL